jgi:predicted dehydrogenase
MSRKNLSTLCPGDGTILSGQIVHHADNLNYLIGPVKRVIALMNKVCTQAEPEDVIAGVVEFENKALGYLGRA